MKIDPDAWYTPRDPQMKRLGSEKTLANRRAAKEGPPFSKIGARIFYKGSDVLAHLEAAKINPAA